MRNTLQIQRYEEQIAVLTAKVNHLTQLDRAHGEPVFYVCTRCGLLYQSPYGCGCPISLTGVAGDAPQVRPADPPAHRLTLEIRTKRGMPGFAGYLAGSVKAGRVIMFLNLDALLWASVEGEPGEFRRSTIDSLAHEFIHALEDQFGLLFDEDAVEAGIARARARDEGSDGHQHATEAPETSATASGMQATPPADSGPNGERAPQAASRNAGRVEETLAPHDEGESLRVDGVPSDRPWCWRSGRKRSRNRRGDGSAGP